jgi:hypothetical protein
MTEAVKIPNCVSRFFHGTSYVSFLIRNMDWASFWAILGHFGPFWASLGHFSRTRLVTLAETTVAMPT